MHKLAIPQNIVERVIARRGKEHVFDDFDPARTALIVVDMQNGFMLPGVAFTEIAEAREIVPNINRLASALRAAGGTVVWIVTTYEPAVDREWSTYYRLSTSTQGAKRSAALTKGATGHAIWSGLEVKPEDPIVEKKRFSAFIQGSSKLDELLKARGIDNLLITGTVTGVCCESTARDAMMLNYAVTMVTDGNASYSDEEHNRALTAFYGTFGDIMPTDMLIDLIAKNGKQQAAE
ncbi:MAG TPA: cysteine hydrolase [Stellaceae bacterium]|jgi:ureidoacrylate peracid hydrolase|nr:cysteine hydrolase [Stellaceae bacterium]